VSKWKAASTQMTWSKVASWNASSAAFIRAKLQPGAAIFARCSCWSEMLIAVIAFGAKCRVSRRVVPPAPHAMCS
jgi:hypothetical protein